VEALGSGTRCVQQGHSSDSGANSFDHTIYRPQRDLVMLYIVYNKLFLVVFVPEPSACHTLRCICSDAVIVVTGIGCVPAAVGL
jgi:hypothetical protein